MRVTGRADLLGLGGGQSSIESPGSTPKGNNESAGDSSGSILRAKTGQFARRSKNGSGNPNINPIIILITLITLITQIALITLITR